MIPFYVGLGDPATFWWCRLKKCAEPLRPPLCTCFVFSFKCEFSNTTPATPIVVQGPKEGCVSPAKVPTTPATPVIPPGPEEARVNPAKVPTNSYPSARDASPTGLSDITIPSPPPDDQPRASQSYSLKRQERDTDTSKRSNSGVEKPGPESEGPLQRPQPASKRPQTDVNESSEPGPSLRLSKRHRIERSSEDGNSREDENRYIYIPVSSIISIKVPDSSHFCFRNARTASIEAGCAM